MSKFLFQSLLLGAIPQMPVQTTYSARLAPAYEGMIPDMGDETIDTFTVETAAGIGFGKVVVQGTGDKQARIAEVGRAFRGITIAAHASEGLVNALSPDLYPQYANVPVVLSGKVWVMASVAVAAGQPVYFVPATGVITNVATANTLIPNSMFETSTTGAGLAVIRFSTTH